MKAAVMSGIGDVNTLSVAEVEIPAVDAEHVLVRVLFCGINHLDVLIRNGKRPGPKVFPHVLGSEIVGELPSGERVAVYPWIFCGACEQCKSGNENICDNGGTIGRTTWGGYAEYVSVPKKNIIELPHDIDVPAACALTLAGTTAFHLVNRAHVQEGNTVLVTGASGGVGNIVVQLLKSRGCTVIGATSHPEKKQHLEEAGVDHVVSVQNMSAEVRRITARGVHAAIDTVGGSVWSSVVECLGKNATMTFCATSLETMGQVQIGSAFSRQLNICGSYGGTIQDAKEIFALQRAGVIKPIIDSVFPLEDAKKAHEKIDTQQLFGKLLITP